MKPIIITRKDVKQQDSEVYFNLRYANKVARLAFDKHPKASMVRISSITVDDNYQDTEVCINGTWVNARIYFKLYYWRDVLDVVFLL